MSELFYQKDPELYGILQAEAARQRDTLEMIASESIQDADSRMLSGSVFCNKTAVGLPGRQRLGGSEYADRLETLAAARACRLFGAAHANVLPYSGTAANFCVYRATLNPGDTVLALDPEQGSHASHGRRGHLSADLYRFVHFGVREADGLLDYDGMEARALTHRPKLIMIGASSYARSIDYARIAAVARRVGACFAVDMAHVSGLVAARVAPSPVEHADIVVGSGTKTMCGVHTGYILCRETYADAIDRGVYPGVVASMHLQTVAAAAWAFQRALSPDFRAQMRQTVRNAQTLCAELQRRGFGVLTGGTDCHMFVLDLRPVRTDAETFAARLAEIGISVNTKKIPFDASAAPNGVRAGCTVLTQRGMRETEMAQIADLFEAALHPERIAAAADTARALCRAFPAPDGE